MPSTYRPLAVRASQTRRVLETRRVFVPFTVRRDAHPAQHHFSTDGGVNWSGWLSATCSGVASTDGGALHARQLYYPYGETRYTSGPLPTDFGFTGQRADSYIKLYQMGARWYNPQTGRWISADTIVPDFANPHSLNRYSYVLGNPLKYVDPSGHQGENPQEPFLQQLIDFFEGQGWQVVGDPINNKSIFCNGPDFVFTSESGRVLVVEAKDVAGNVNLGTLGKSQKFQDYGGSILRVVRQVGRFIKSGIPQLRQEAEIVRQANQAGTLENALFTTSGGVSQGAQDQFQGVYTLGSNGQVTAIKALESLSFKERVLGTLGATAATTKLYAKLAWEGTKTWAKGTFNLLSNAPVIIAPEILLDFTNPYNPLSPYYGLGGEPVQN